MSLDSIYYCAVANGEMAFGASEPRKEPCGEYLLDFRTPAMPTKWFLKIATPSEY